MNLRSRVESLAAITFLAAGLPFVSRPATPAGELRPEEATVAAVHAALAAGRLTSCSSWRLISSGSPRLMTKGPR
jgi:hypothetical protein